MTHGGDRALAARRLLGSLYARALAANALGATVAFVYLAVVAPPQPEPSHDEWLYLSVAPSTSSSPGRSVIG